MLSPLQQLTDEELMARLQSGRKDCFELLYERYRVKLYNYLLRLCCSSQRAEDLLHDSFMKVIEHPGKFNTQLRFSTWIYTVATNLYRNEARNMETHKRLLQSGPTQNSIEHNYEPKHIDRMNFRKELDKFIDGMGDGHKTIFLLRFREELTIPEISKILNIPEGTVKSRLFYMMKQMATAFRAYDPAG